jgi:peptidoglycan-N-acetylglucosamine deacetylase
MRTTRSGSIILEHDGGGDRSQTVAALTIALPQLLDAGYRFRTP